MNDKPVEDRLKVTSFEILVSINERIGTICKERDIKKKDFVHRALLKRIEEYEGCPVSVSNHTANKMQELIALVDEMRSEKEDGDLEREGLRSENVQMKAELINNSTNNS